MSCSSGLNVKNIFLYEFMDDIIVFIMVIQMSHMQKVIVHKAPSCLNFHWRETEE